MNLFPTTATRPDGTTVREVRVTYYGRDGGTVAWTWSGGSRPVVLVQAPGRPTSDGKVHTLDVDGEAWTFTEGGGCGCGHPLKRFSPPHPTALAGARRAFSS